MDHISPKSHDLKSEENCCGENKQQKGFLEKTQNTFYFSVLFGPGAGWRAGMRGAGWLAEFNENIKHRFPSQRPGCPSGNARGKEGIDRPLYLPGYPINLSTPFPWGTGGGEQRTKGALGALASHSDGRAGRRTRRLVALLRIAPCWPDVGTSPDL